MKLKTVFASLLIIFGCSQDPKLSFAEDAVTHQCVLTVGEPLQCVIDETVFVLAYTRNELGEIILSELSIEHKDKSEALDVSDDAVFLPGETILIQRLDINFDGHQDLALSTVSGAANLYFDYWVYSPEDRRHYDVGNFAEFEIDAEKKQLRHTIKESAADYTNKVYVWQDNDLVELP